MTEPWESARLGQDPQEHRLSRPAQMATAAARLAAQASRAVRIWTPDLEPRLYDTQPFLDALRALALGARRAEVRVLVADARRAMQLGHRLPELARQMTSSVEIRRLPPEPADRPEAFLVADLLGYLYRPVAHQAEAALCFHDPLRARDLARSFDAVWDCATLEPETRRLHL